MDSYIEAFILIMQVPPLIFCLFLRSMEFNQKMQAGPSPGGGFLSGGHKYTTTRFVNVMFWSEVDWSFCSLQEVNIN